MVGIALAFGVGGLCWAGRVFTSFSRLFVSCFCFPFVGSSGLPFGVRGVCWLSVLRFGSLAILLLFFLAPPAKDSSDDNNEDHDETGGEDEQGGNRIAPASGVRGCWVGFLCFRCCVCFLFLLPLCGVKRPALRGEA